MKVSVGAGKKAIVWLVAIVFIVAAIAVSFTIGGMPTATAEAQSGGEATPSEPAAVGVDVGYGGQSFNFTDFHSAWDKAVALGGTSSEFVKIKLNQDVKVSKVSLAGSGKYIEVDLNGYTIDRGLTKATAVSDGSRMFNVFGGYVRITDTHTDTRPDGKLTGVVLSKTAASENRYGGVAKVNNGGTLELVRGIMTGNQATDAPCVLAEENGTFRMSGGELSGNTAYNTAGAVQIGGYTGNVNNNANSYLYITGGKLADNRTQNQYDGGAIILRTGVYASIQNCEISGNTCTGVHGGGAIHIQTDVRLATLKNVKFINNTSTVGNGGAILSNVALTLEGCEFTGNSSSSKGGAIYAPAVTATNTTFTSNSAAHGGAIHCNGNISLTGCTFDGNSALGNGGAVSDEEAIEQATRTITSCAFTNNTAGDSGGAIIARKSVTIYGTCTFTGNSANNGGAIHMRLNGAISRHIDANVSFTENTANDKGGAIMIDLDDSNTASARTLDNYTFTKNSAVNKGGAIYVKANKFILTDSAFTENRCENGDGGGVAVERLRNVEMKNVVFNNNYAMGSGGGFADISTGRGGELPSLAISINKFTADGNTVKNGEGGALCLGGWVDLSATGALSFTNNTARSGGAIRIGAGINLADCDSAYFAGNTATFQGGAIISYYGTDADQNKGIKGVFENNTAASTGGALFLNGPASRILDAEFKGNSALEGGAVFVNANNSVGYIKNTTFTNNEATTGCGGAVLTETSNSLAIEGSTFKQNSAALDGGALYYRAFVDNADNSFSSNTFTDNSAARNGGAVYVGGGRKIANGGSIFTGNSAERGGAFYVAAGARVTAANSQVRSNRANIAGGGYFLTGASTELLLNYASPTIVGNLVGATVADDGSVSGGTTSNVYLDDNGYIQVTVALNSSARVTVSSAEELGAVTAVKPGTGVTLSVANFAAERAGWITRASGGNILLGKLIATVSRAGTETGYFSFKEAWETNVIAGSDIPAADNMTFTLMADTVVDFTIPNADATRNAAFALTKGYVTLDLNGHTLDRGGAAGRLFCLNGECQMTIKDGSAAAAGKLIGGDVSAPSPYGDHRIGGVAALRAGTLVLESGTLSGNKAALGGAVALYTPGVAGTVKSQFIMNGGVIEGNQATGNGGGAIYADEHASVQIKGGVIRNNEAGGNGGAIYVTANASKALSVSDCTIEGNYAKSNGGAISYAHTTDAWTMTNVTLRNNIAGGNGGAIYTDAAVTVKGSTMEGNSATYDGGAIYFHSTTAKWSIADSTMTGNAADQGGAICTKGMLTVTSCTIDGNTADSFGGGIYFSASEGISETSLTVTGNTSIINNTAGYGGGMTVLGTASSNASKIYIGADVVINGNNAKVGGGIRSAFKTDMEVYGTISGNSATEGYGGGISIEGNENSKLVLATGSSVLGNSAVKDGGGIYSGTAVTEIAGTISGNTAQNGAGIYALKQVNIKGATISDNIASVNGGGVYFLSADAVMTAGTISGNTAVLGGGIYLESDNFDYKGGSVTGNKGSELGGGIYVGNGSLTIDAVTPDINGNTSGTDTVNNVYVHNGAMSVGVNIAAVACVSVAVRSVPFAITRANESVTLNAENFVSENTQYTFEQLYDGNLALGEAQFTVTFNGTSVKTHFLDTAFHYAASYETTEADRAIVEMGRDGIFYKQEHITVPASAHVTLMMNGYNITAAFATAPQYGGAFYVEGDLRVENGSFVNCVAADEGAAIYATLKSKLEMYDVDFVANNTVNNTIEGSAVFIGLHFVIEGCVFSDHKSVCVKQDITLTESGLTNYMLVNNCEFTRNASESIQSTLRTDTDIYLNINITKSRFYGNVGVYEAEGVLRFISYLKIKHNGKIVIDECDFESNDIYNSGRGVIYIDGSIDVETRNCNFINNQVYYDIYYFVNNIYIEDTHFSFECKDGKDKLRFITLYNNSEEDVTAVRNCSFTETIVDANMYRLTSLINIMQGGLIKIANIKHTIINEVPNNASTNYLFTIYSDRNDLLGEVNGFETNIAQAEYIFDYARGVAIRNINLSNCRINREFSGYNGRAIFENITVTNCQINRNLFSIGYEAQLNNVKISNNVFTSGEYEQSALVLSLWKDATIKQEINGLHISNNHFIKGSGFCIDNIRAVSWEPELIYNLNLYLSGNIIIEENYTGCTIDADGKVIAIGKEQNVTATKYNANNITNIYTSQLSPTSRIGITPWENPAIGQKSLIAQSTPGSLALAGNFFSDDANYMLAQDGSDVVLVPYTKAAVGAVVEWKARTYNYGDFDSAFAFAGALDTTAADPAVVRPLWDATTRGCYLDAGRYVTVDLNGYTIDRGAKSPITDGYGFIVLGGLKITDSRGGGVITGGNNMLYGGAFLVTAGGSLTIEGGTITGNRADMGGGVYVAAGGRLAVNGGIIENNGANYGGGIYAAEDAAVTVSGGEVRRNSALYGGGAYLLGSMSVTDDAKISGNEADDVYLLSGRSITVTGTLAPTAVIGVATEAVPNEFADVEIARAAEGVTITDGAFVGKYAVITDGSRALLSVNGVTMVGLDVVFDSGAETVFDTTQLEELRNYLTVKGKMSDGTVTDAVTDYTLMLDPTKDGLTVGENELTVLYKGRLEKIKIEVKKFAIVEIAANYVQGEDVIYSNEDASRLAELLGDKLTVIGKTAEGVETRLYDYTLTLAGGATEFIAGENTIVVTFGEITGEFIVNVTELYLASITAETTGAIYDGATLDDVRARLKVTGEMNDGSRYFGDVSYTLEILGAEALAVGNNSVRVTATDGSKTCTTDITVVVTAIRISEITVTFDQGETVVYTSATMDALKTALAAQITISGKRNNGEEVASVTEYTLSTASGKLVLGQNVVTVTAEDATATIMVTATGVEVTEITVNYNTNGATIYTSNTLDSLRQYLTVAGKNNDGTTTDSMTEYTLAYAEGVDGLAVGANTITVKADKLTKTFEVTAAEVLATGITAAFAQGDTVVFTSDEANGDKIRALTTVTINYNDGSAVETQGYTLTGSLTAGTVSLTATLDADTNMTAAVENVTVTEVALASITATLDPTATLYEGDSQEKVKSYITVTGTNNDGSPYAGEISGMIESAETLALGENEITILYNGLRAKLIVTAQKIDIAGIKAAFTQGDIVVYSSAAEADIKGLISSGLTVVGINNNGSETAAIADYEVTIKFGSALVLGQNILTVTYRGYTAEIILVTSAVAQSGITAAYDAGENKVYTSAALDSLLGYVTVTGVNNDGSTFAIATGYRLEFKNGAAALTAGVNTLAVVYKEFTADIEVTAATVELTSIDAVYDGTGITVYESLPIGSLKGAIGSGLTVTGHYNDGSSAVIDEYALSAAGDGLTAGANEVTVTVGSCTALISVTAQAVLLERIEAVFRPGLNAIYESSTLADLIDYLTVKGYNNDGSETAPFTITADMLSIAQTGDNVFVAGDNTVTVTAEGKTAQFTVTAAAVQLEQITVTFDQTGITVYEGLALDDIKEKIKSGLTVNGKYNNGVALDGITDYTISLDAAAEALAAGDNTVYVSYGSKYGTVTVNATAIALDRITAVFDFTGKAYTSTTLESLKPHVMLTGTNNDGSEYTGDMSEFTLSIASGGTTLLAGVNSVTVTFSGKTYIFNVFANNVALERLDVVFDAASVKVYTSTALESLRTYLTVTGYNNDGSRYSGDMSTYTLSIGSGDTNAIFEGENEVIVGYGGITEKFTVTAEKVKVDALSATFDQTNIKVYTSAMVEGLKGIISDGLAVTGSMNDGTTLENMADYTLSLKVGDKLMLGQNIITVSYGDTSCDIIVVVSAVELDRIEVSADFGRDTLYTSADEAKLRGYLTVNGINNDGTKEEGVTGYTLTLPAGGLADGNNELTVAYKGKTAKVTVAATAVAISRLDAKFEQGEARIYTNDDVNGAKIRGMITLTVYYNDGTSEVTQDYTVTGSLTEGTVSLTATLNSDATRTAAIDGVRVMGVTLERIEAAYENSGTVYVSADINSLKKYIRLTGVNNDGSAYAGSLSEFTLSFAEGKTALEAGANVLTVSFDDGYGAVTTTVTVTAEAVTVSRITVTFSQGNIAIYTSATADSLKTAIADVTTVTAIYSDGSTAVTADYTLAFDGALAMGQNLVTVAYEGANATIMVNAAAVALESIAADFTQSETKVYTSATADSLKALLADMLTVTGTNNDGSTIENISDYALTFAGDRLTAGANTVTVNYGGKTIGITVTATEVALESIAVDFTQGEMKIYTSATADSLKKQLANVLTVTGKNNDGSDYGAITDYALSFEGSALSVGANTVTVSYGGKNTTFDVSAIQATIVDIEASYDAGGDTVYTSAALDSLKKYIKVTGIAADGIKHTLAEGYTLTLAQGETLAEGNNTVTVTYEGLIDEITVAAVGVKIVGIDANFAQGETKVYTSADIAGLKAAIEGCLTVNAKYNDGTVTENVSGYAVALKSGSALLVGQNLLTVSYDGVSADIVLNVSAVELARIDAAIDLNGNVVYTSGSVDDLKQYVTVTGTNNDGSAVTNITEFTVTAVGGLKAGTNTLTVTYAGKTANVTVEVTAVAIVSITAEFAQGETVIFTSDSADGEKIRAMVKVTVHYNDGTSEETADFTISGELTAGTAALTVALTADGTMTADVDAVVTAVALESIEVAIDTLGETVYAGTSADALKKYVTIKGTNNDGSVYTGGFDGYVISAADGALAAGENVLTVTFGEVSATAKVYAEEVVLARVEAEYAQGEDVISAGITIEELSALIADKLVVKGYNNDGSAYEGSLEYTLSLKFGGETLVAGNNIVTVNAGGIADEIAVNAFAGNTYTKIEAAVAQSGAIYTSTPLSEIRKYLTVTLDGAPITGYELVYADGESALKAGRNTLIVKFLDASEAVEVDVTAVELAEIRITASPAKLNYTAYETLVTDGMTVTAVYNDGSTKTVTDHDVVYGNNNGYFNYGETSATVRYAEGGTVKTAEIEGITVARIVVARPAVTGDYRYSGETLTAAIAQQSCYALSGDLTAKNAGSYTVTATLTDDNYAWEDSEERAVSIGWTIEKAVYDMSGVTFEGKEFVQDGANKSLSVAGELPSGVAVEYVNNSHAEAGVYTVTARFTGDANYEAIADMTATLTVKAKQMSGTDSNVIVDSEEGLHPDYTLDVKDVTDEDNSGIDLGAIGENAEIMQSYDVSLKNGNVPVSPEKSITVKLLISEELRGSDGLKVYYVSDTGALVDMNAVRDGNYMVFETKLFSRFIIVGEGTPAFTPGITEIAALASGGGLVLILVGITVALAVRRKRRSA